MHNKRIAAFACWFRVLFFISFSGLAFAEDMPGMQHQHGPMEGKAQEASPPSEFLMSEAAGTGVNPGSAHEHMMMKMKGEWQLMAHGFAFLNSINQTGPRGDDRVFSTNHLMLAAERSLTGKSSLMLRTMLSLEPATVTDRQFPELFQTGETAFGKPIVDGQHPHDFLMEISLQYVLQLNEHTLLHFYAAPVGDPALGPVAYPHRLSAQELPQATLSHHLQDSSHIVNEVLTAGIKYKFVRWEVSGFHGAEPDEERWDLDTGAIDSWSTRVTINPDRDWVAQISTGRLKKPEASELGNIQRTTASILYNRVSPHGFWAISFLFGHNHKIAEHRDTNGFGMETLYQFMHRNYLTARAELVDKDELFANDPALQQHFESIGKLSFRINAFTFGYARDFDLFPGWGTGIGGNVTVYSFPSDLKTFYGTSPKAFLLYFRIRPGH